VLAEPCGALLREFFAERRAQQRQARDDAVIPTGEVSEIMAPPADEAAAS